MPVTFAVMGMWAKEHPEQTRAGSEAAKGCGNTVSLYGDNVRIPACRALAVRFAAP